MTVRRDDHEHRRGVSELGVYELQEADSPVDRVTCLKMRRGSAASSADAVKPCSGVLSADMKAFWFLLRYSSIAGLFLLI